MPRYVIAITFANAHVDREHSFHTYTDAMKFAREGISYSGGKIRRVELLERNAWRPDEILSTRALWDTSWDAVSKAAGLRNSR